MNFNAEVQVYTEICSRKYEHIWVAQLVKNLPAMQETWVRSLDWEKEIPGDL